MTRPIFQRTGDVLILRAAALPVTARPAYWPDIDSPEACRQWLERVWAEDAFVTSLAAASPRLVDYVERILAGEDIGPKRIRRATCSVAGYLLRATGRPTPFGLFAGVALTSVGDASARIGPAHRAVARPDTSWVDQVRRELEGRIDVLPHLTIQTSSLTSQRGDTISTPRSGGRIATARISGPLSVLLRAAQTPTRGRELLRLLTETGGTPEQAARLLGRSLADGYLISSLCAPMTVDDPAGHALRILSPHAEDFEPGTCEVLAKLDKARHLLDAHNQASGPAAHKLRESADDLMQFAGAASRSRIAVDLRLDARVCIPRHVLDEAEHAADALVRLTRARGEAPAWAAYATHFWARYGAGVLVPVSDAVDLAAGVGLPADYPMSLWAETPPRVLPRDEHLAAEAMQAAVTGTREIVFTSADIDTLSDRNPAEPVAPHVELAIRIRAKSSNALDDGDFLLDVRPAWTAGALSGRFTALLGTGLSDLYPRLPTMVEGALPAQLSFPPVFAHGENVARIPPVLPHVLSVGEHREPDDHIVGVDDLAVFSTGKRLHLASISRRRVVEPLVLHPLALKKQAPPLARFLAMLSRGSVTAWTSFDWGPVAAALPFLPRVRYRRTILSPARWKLPAAALPTGPFTQEWHQALRKWAATWRCPALLDLRDGDRSISLDLSEPLHACLIHQHLQHHDSAVLAEATPDGELGWIGHAHEITMPLAAAGPQIRHPDLTRAPLVTNRDLRHPGGTGRWLQAKVFTHPTVMDQIITRRLPNLLEDLGTAEAWFTRYRSLHETDHLRIRVPTRPGSLRIVAAWTEQLVAERLASHLTVDGYHPESGRYGTGSALEAAEAVFVADSLVARHALTALPHLPREVLCALSLIDLTEGFLGTREGRAWMATAAPHHAGRPENTRPTVDHVRSHPMLTASSQLATALAQRRNALGAYRAHVPEQKTEHILESLLHMNHNRMAGPDRASESAARHAARQACRSLTTQEDT